MTSVRLAGAFLAAGFTVLVLASVGVQQARGSVGCNGVNGGFNLELGITNTCNYQTTLSGNTFPLFVISSGETALLAQATAAVGGATGVQGESHSSGAYSNGVLGLLTSGAPGISSAGVFGNSGSMTANGPGVWGYHGGETGTAPGVYGSTGSTTADAAGVYGSIRSNAANAAGVRGYNASASCCGMGVAGFHAGQGIGVYGEADNGFAVSGFSPNNWSGYFQGSVNVVGTLFKSGGAFRIDHPLDPAHKYLQHSFVESPDMMNVYNGNVVTNGKGFATVKLPAYFHALNRDFRYQLTSLSGLQMVAVATEISHSRFTIQSQKPNSRVSWQVTGIRKDPYANTHRIKTVVPKTGSADNKYVHPELYGKPLAKSVVVLPGMMPGTKAKFEAARVPSMR